jgi:2'-5' RNA ligase
MYTFHVTFEDQPAVQELAAEARQRLAGLDGLDLVPGQWLHLTTQGVGFTDEVSDDDLDAIISAARARLAGLALVAVTLTPPQVASEGIACHVGPDGVLTPARDALRGAIGDVWGPERVPEGSDWSPHVSIAYASADSSGDAFAAALDGLPGASVIVHAMDLIRLGRDQRIYEWETVERLPLGGSAATM